MGLTLTWLSVIILIPLAGLFLKTLDLSFEHPKLTAGSHAAPAHASAQMNS